MSIQCLKASALTEIAKAADGALNATLYDGSSLDRDGEGIDWANCRVSDPMVCNADHSHSVLMTVGKWTGVHVAGQKLRGTLVFAPAGVSEVADQIHRQVDAGLTTTLSIVFRGTPTQAPDGHRVWRDVEVFGADFVTVPASPGAKVDGKALRRWVDGDESIELDLDVGDLDLDDLGAALRELLVRQRMPGVLAGLVQPETIDIDARELTACVAAIVAHAIDAAAIRGAVERALNRMRGRVD